MTFGEKDCNLVTEWSGCVLKFLRKTLGTLFGLNDKPPPRTWMSVAREYTGELLHSVPYFSSAAADYDCSLCDDTSAAATAALSPLAVILIGAPVCIAYFALTLKSYHYINASLKRLRDRDGHLGPDALLLFRADADVTYRSRESRWRSSGEVSLYVRRDRSDQVPKNVIVVTMRRQGGEAPIYEAPRFHRLALCADSGTVSWRSAFDLQMEHIRKFTLSFSVKRNACEFHAAAVYCAQNATSTLSNSSDNTLNLEDITFSTSSSDASDASNAQDDNNGDALSQIAQTRPDYRIAWCTKADSQEEDYVWDYYDLFYDLNRPDMARVDSDSHRTSGIGLERSLPDADDDIHVSNGGLMDMSLPYKVDQNSSPVGIS